MRGRRGGPAVGSLPSRSTVTGRGDAAHPQRPPISTTYAATEEQTGLRGCGRDRGDRPRVGSPRAGRPAPDERADRRRAVHLGSNRRSSRRGAAPQDAAARPALVGAAGRIGAAGTQRAAGAGDPVHRPGRRARRADGGARRAPPRHGDRSRRDRQEPSGDQRRRGSRCGAARRLLVRRPRAADGSGGRRQCRGRGRRLVAAVGVDAGRRVGRIAGSPRRNPRVGQLRASARRRSRLRRADRDRVSPDHGAGDDPHPAAPAVRVPVRGARALGTRRGRAVRRTRPRGHRRDGVRRRAESVRCARHSTGWRWRSSWPRLATRRWVSTDWKPVCTSGCGSSPWAATRLGGTARSGTRSDGATTCSIPPTRHCCAAWRCSPRGSTSTPPWPWWLPGAAVATVADGLARLVDHSLLVVDRSTPTRYRALETIRQYGQEQLETTNELAEVEHRHEAWCCAVLAEIAAAEPDDAWCARFDRVVDDARAALVRCAAFHDHRADAAALAARLAGQLWLRGRLTEARRWFEQAADLEPAPAKRVELLRDAAGAAGTGFAGNDLLRLLRRSADLALSLGDARGAAHDLAWMSLTFVRSPGIMAETHTPEEGAALLAEARAISDGSDTVEAAIAVAQAFADYVGLTVERAEEAVALARQARDPDPRGRSVGPADRTAPALQRPSRSGRHRAPSRAPGRIAATSGPRNGFEHSDHCLYGSEVLLAAGDLRGAAEYAERLARLPFHRDEEFLGLARRLKVNAIAGRFDDVLRDASRFRASWERDGRPVVPNLAQLCLCRGDGARHPWRRRRPRRVGADHRRPPRRAASRRPDLRGCRRSTRSSSSTGGMSRSRWIGWQSTSTIRWSGGTPPRRCTGRGTPPSGPRRPCWPGVTTQSTGSLGPAVQRGTTRSPPRWWSAPRRSPQATALRSPNWRRPSRRSAARTRRLAPTSWLQSLAGKADHTRRQPSTTDSTSSATRARDAAAPRTWNLCVVDAMSGFYVATGSP